MPNVSALRFIVILRPVPHGVDHLGRDPHYRLRVLLKRALRYFGLRCEQVRVEETSVVEADGAVRS